MNGTTVKLIEVEASMRPKNQALIDWSAHLAATYEEQIEHELRVIELIEAGIMHTWTNDQDTTAESLDRAKRAVEAYREGIRIMAKAKLELEADG